MLINWFSRPPNHDNGKSMKKNEISSFYQYQLEYFYQYQLNNANYAYFKNKISQHQKSVFLYLS